MMKFFFIDYDDIKLRIGYENEKIYFVEFTDFVETKAESLFEKRVEKNFVDYLSGNLKEIQLNFCMNGSEFEKSVWNELLKIPYGDTVTYKEIAVRIGKEKGARAVGGACGRNKIAIIIPCHRVVGSNGKLTGFAGGLDNKTKLLKLENAKKMLG